MTAIPATPEKPAEVAYSMDKPDYLKVATTIRSWAGTMDHKRIGIMYLVGTAMAFLVGSLLALLMQIHHLTPEGTVFDPDGYSQAFTLHGLCMVFLFGIPAIPAFLGNFILPLQLGARNMALPRLNLASFYLWLAAVVLVMVASAMGPIDTGWTLWAPLSIYSKSAVVMMGLAICAVGISTVLTGFNFVVTTHKLRAPGQGWFKMPLFVWGIYAAAILQIMSTPVLVVGVLLLVLDRLFHIGVFDPHNGGDPVLFQHFFWFYSQPALYIMLLPAAGTISEVISVHARKPISGYRIMVFSVLALAGLSFLVWGKNMFVSGQSELTMWLFSFLAFFLFIPSALMEANWIATIWKGSISLSAAMLYALFFLIHFAVAALMGIVMASLNLGIHLQDTSYAVAQFHYAMMGCVGFAFFAGLHHWWPKVFGVMYSRLWSNVAAILIFVGHNLTFIPQLIMGSQGMPRRHAQYLEGWAPYHQASSIGTFIMGIGLTVMVGYLLHSFLAGEKTATRNPWGAATLEWEVDTPPMVENFEQAPVVTRDPYDYSEILRPGRSGS